MSLATQALRDAGNTALADQAQSELATWGDVPPTVLPVGSGAPRLDVTHLVGGNDSGRVLLATDMLRGLDLLDVPFPEEGAQQLVAFFDAHDRLTEMLLIYRARLSDHYPEAGDLALLLENRSLSGKDQESPGLRHAHLSNGRHALPGGGGATERCPGAWVRLAEEKPAGQTPALKRDFGAINLDRSFEQNRVRIAPEQSADTIQTDRAAALDEITSPCSTLRPQGVILRRQTGCDLTESLTMRYSPEDTALPLCQVALPLWATWGPGALAGVDDQHGGHLALVWEDARTRYELCSPYIAGQQLEFTVRHRAGSEKLDERAAQVTRSGPGGTHSQNQLRQTVGTPATLPGA